jgi:MFS transporter, FHS family, L-fucose permease
MKSKYQIPFILVTCLFFLWGIAHNLNPILIPHLKKACQLTDLQSAFIDSAFYLAYFLVAIPAGLVMKKYGYKAGIVGGLVLFAVGAFMFVPAANYRVYGIFLAALFVIASGLTFLETAANPYITVLGEPETASQRINFAQSFNGLAASIAPFVGGFFILSGKNLSNIEGSGLTTVQINEILNTEAAAVKLPYIIIGLVVLAVAFLIYKADLPEITEHHDIELNSQNSSIWRHKHLAWGVIAQFFYVGAQVCVSSFFIRYLDKTAGIEEKAAANYLGFALLAFMIGRFVGTFLMKFIKANTLLMYYGLFTVILLLVVVTQGGMVSVYALIGVEFFMSIMFPTIFSLSVQSLGEDTKMGSSLVIMAIVGGAILPLFMGQLSDQTNIQTAYWVPLLCFLVVVYFGWQGYKIKKGMIN